MTAQELQRQVLELNPEELRVFEEWFENYMSDQWDAAIESDARAGKLDFLVAESDADYGSGKCKPL